MPFVSVNGVRLRAETLPHRRAERRPDAVPLVFVHGLAASSAFWMAAGVQTLTGHGACLMYDLRGHGKSDTPNTGYGLTHMADDLLGLLDQQGIAKAHIVAHSFGGMIALRAAVKAPDRVVSLTLADTRIRPLQQTITLPKVRLPAGRRARLDDLGSAEIPQSETGDGVHYLETVARIQLAAGKEADALLSAIYQHPGLFRSRRNAQKWITLAERASFVEEMTTGESFSAQDLAALECPMLILVGDKSPTRPSACALIRLCPAARLRQIAEAGHFFPLSQPRSFLRPTWRFIRAVNAGQFVPETDDDTV